MSISNKKKTQNKNSTKEKKENWIILNKRKNFNFKIYKTWEAGIILKGPDVKSILKGQFNFKNSYIFIDYRQEVYLSNFQLKNNQQNKNEKRNYKLLLNRSEIKDLEKAKKEKKYTIIPTKIYLKKHKIKVAIAIAKGLKKYEKKQKIIEKDIKKNIKI